MGIFGPTSPYHWAPLNGLAATVQTKTVVPCQPCHRPVCTMNDHRCMRDIPASDVVDIAQRVLAEAGAPRPEPTRACAAAARSLPKIEPETSARCRLRPGQSQRPDRSPSGAFARSPRARDAGRSAARRRAENRRRHRRGAARGQQAPDHRQWRQRRRRPAYRRRNHRPLQAGPAGLRGDRADHRHLGADGDRQ